ncbi:hypothetical protein D3C71_549170 [compost metagenome]
MLCTEQFLRTITSDIFYDINMFTSTVEAFARITFSVFVRQYGAKSFHNRFTYNVLGGNQFNVVALTLKLQIHSLKYSRVLLSQIFHVLHPPII